MYKYIIRVLIPLYDRHQTIILSQVYLKHSHDSADRKLYLNANAPKSSLSAESSVPQEMKNNNAEWDGILEFDEDAGDPANQELPTCKGYEDDPGLGTGYTKYFSQSQNKLADICWPLPVCLTSRYKVLLSSNTWDGVA